MSEFLLRMFYFLLFNLYLLFWLIPIGITLRPPNFDQSMNLAMMVIRLTLFANIDLTAFEAPISDSLDWSLAALYTSETFMEHNISKLCASGCIWHCLRKQVSHNHRFILSVHDLIHHQGHDSLYLFLNNASHLLHTKFSFFYIFVSNVNLNIWHNRFWLLNQLLNLSLLLRNLNLLNYNLRWILMNFFQWFWNCLFYYLNFYLRDLVLNYRDWLIDHLLLTFRF